MDTQLVPAADTVRAVPPFGGATRNDVDLCNECAARVPEHSTGDQSSWVDKPPTFKIV